MTQDDDIIKLAREAGITTPVPADRRWHLGACCPLPALERFAALAAAAEREACADILDRNADRCDPYSIAFDVLDSNAKAIRARGQQ